MPARWGSSDPYEKDPVVQKVWKHTGCIPVLPRGGAPLLDLSVFSVLMKVPVSGRYQKIGDLGSLCTPGGREKRFLRAAVAAAASGSVHVSADGFGPSYTLDRREMFTIKAGSSEYQMWSAKLLSLLLGGHSRGVVSEVTVSDLEEEGVGIDGFKALLKLFSPDQNDELLRAANSRSGAGCFGGRSRGGPKVELFVVRTVVRASKIEIVESRLGGAQAGAGVPEALGPLAGLPLGASALQIKGERVSNSSSYYLLKAPKLDEGGDGLLPIGFNGLQLTYSSNWELQNTELAKMSIDSIGPVEMEAVDNGPTTDGPSKNDPSKSDPTKDVHLRDFVSGSDWFATVHPQGHVKAEFA